MYTPASSQAQLIQLNTLQQPNAPAFTVHQLGDPANYSNDLKKLFADTRNLNLGTSQVAGVAPILPLQELYQLTNVVQPDQFRAAQTPNLPLQDLYQLTNVVQPDQFRAAQTPILPLQELYQLSNVVQPEQFNAAQIKLPILPLQQLWEVEQKNAVSSNGNTVTNETVETKTEVTRPVNKGAIAAGVAGTALLAGAAIAAAVAANK